MKFNVTKKWDNTIEARVNDCIIDPYAALQNSSIEELESMNDSIAYKNLNKSINDKIRLLNNLAIKYNTPRRREKSIDIPFIRANRKTGNSVDFRNTCDGKCTYCYVNSPSMVGQLKDHKWELDPSCLTPTREKIFREEYLQERKKIVPSYFLRFFSLADGYPSDAGLLKKILEICNEEKVKTVVISKKDYTIKTAYPLATSTLYSIDNGNYNAPSSWSRFVELKKEMPNLRGFYMIVDYTELKTAFQRIAKDNIDKKDVQFIGYHGQLHDTKQAKTMVHSITGKTIKPVFVDMLTNGQGCCSDTGKCLGCHLACGIRKPSKVKYIPNK